MGCDTKRQSSNMISSLGLLIFKEWLQVQFSLRLTTLRFFITLHLTVQLLWEQKYDSAHMKGIYIYAFILCLTFSTHSITPQQSVTRLLVFVLFFLLHFVLNYFRMVISIMIMTIIITVKIMGSQHSLSSVGSRRVHFIIRLKQPTSKQKNIYTLNLSSTAVVCGICSTRKRATSDLEYRLHFSNSATPYTPNSKHSMTAFLQPLS